MARAIFLILGRIVERIVLFPFLVVLACFGILIFGVPDRREEEDEF